MEIEVTNKDLLDELKRRGVLDIPAFEKMTEEEFEREKRKREFAKEKQRQEEAKKAKLEKYKYRRPCPINGMAHGSEVYDSNDLVTLQLYLTGLNVPGNCGQYYTTTLRVSSAVQTYLNNTISEMDKRVFQKKLDALYKEFIETALADINTRATLLCLEDTRASEWQSEAIKVIHSLVNDRQELVEAIKKSDKVHGQRRLLEAALAAYPK